MFGDREFSFFVLATAADLYIASLGSRSAVLKHLMALRLTWTLLDSNGILVRCHSQFISGGC